MLRLRALRCVILFVGIISMENLEKISGQAEKEATNPAEEQSNMFGDFDPEKARQEVEDRRKEIEERENLVVEGLSNRMEELRSTKVPEGKFKIPPECFDEVSEMLDDASKRNFSEQKEYMRNMAKYRLNTIEKLDGKVEEDIGEKLWSLYNDPDISVGIHGTIDEANSGVWSEDSPVFTDGLSCAYGDLRRTINFQDRGMVHAHGNVSFPELLSYDYPAYLLRKPLTVKKLKKQLTNTLQEIYLLSQKFFQLKKLKNVVQ